MTKNKTERINQEITKIRGRIAEYQEELKALEARKIEVEDLEIVQTMCVLRMTPVQLGAILPGGTIPGSMVDDNNKQEENSYEEQTIASNTFYLLSDAGPGIGLYYFRFCPGHSVAPGRGYHQ